MDKEILELRLGAKELDDWHRVCAALKEAGAVSDADLDASPGSDDDTPGKAALTAIRLWGDQLVRLRAVQLAMGKNFTELPDEVLR